MLITNTIYGVSGNKKLNKMQYNVIENSFLLFILMFMCLYRSVWKAMVYSVLPVKE